MSTEKHRITLMQVAATHLQPGDVIVNRLQGVPDGYAIQRPAPEPEWEPGTVADIEVDHETYRAIRTELGKWSTDRDWDYSDAEVGGVRPLVVIDPADVALRTRIAEVGRVQFGGPVEAWSDFASEVVVALGLTR